ncbi:hypothetical protein [Nocardia harenae]|uniref:hypothetical protein n=1 Tax=Nocardia harenae TaxID=358707 RepID=UPI0009FF8C20|nr:hypothetical protein [Nocardia harenae]
MPTHSRALTESERAWLRSRSYLRENRLELDRAAADQFPELQRVAGSALLARREWLPTDPFPLHDIALRGRFDQPEIPAPLPRSSAMPLREDGSPYETYSAAVRGIAAPTVFENRPTYRLSHADLAGGDPVLEFGVGHYFDSVDVGEAAAHEFAVAHRDGVVQPGVRTAITDPCDLRQRPANLAISTLTIRRDTRTGEREFLLHWRDPRKTGHAGGLYQVVPVGVFQPSGYAAWNTDNDFSLWHNMIREFAEELGGADEDHGSEKAPIDYGSWDFAKRIDREIGTGSIEAYCLGLGVDPTSFATDLLTAVVIDGPVFDELFGDIPADNDEGRVLELQPFTVEHVRRLRSEHPMQAAGAAALGLAITGLR